MQKISTLNAQRMIDEYPRIHTKKRLSELNFKMLLQVLSPFAHGHAVKKLLGTSKDYCWNIEITVSAITLSLECRCCHIHVGFGGSACLRSVRRVRSVSSNPLTSMYATAAPEVEQWGQVLWFSNHRLIHWWHPTILLQHVANCGLSITSLQMIHLYISHILSTGSFLYFTSTPSII